MVIDAGKGGTAPNPIIWCSEIVAQRRRVVEAVRDFTMLLGYESFWAGGAVRDFTVLLGYESFWAGG